MSNHRSVSDPLQSNRRDHRSFLAASHGPTCARPFWATIGAYSDGGAGAHRGSSVLSHLTQSDKAARSAKCVGHVYISSGAMRAVERRTKHVMTALGLAERSHAENAIISTSNLPSNRKVMTLIRSGRRRMV